MIPESEKASRKLNYRTIPLVNIEAKVLNRLFVN